VEGAKFSPGALINLAPGYALDVEAQGYVGLTFNVQTYPGLKELIARQFELFRERAYAARPEWKAQGYLDNGIEDLDKLGEDLVRRFLHPDPQQDHCGAQKSHPLRKPAQTDLLCVTPQVQPGVERPSNACRDRAETGPMGLISRLRQKHCADPICGSVGNKRQLRYVARL
jgi:hypothetical protein